MSDAAKRAAWGRIGGLRAWSRNPPEVMLGAAWAGSRRRFVHQVAEAAVGRGEVLTPAELASRAERAERAYMLGLAARSAEVRRERAARP